MPHPTPPAAGDLDLLLGVATTPKLTILIPVEPGTGRQILIQTRNLVRLADERLAAHGLDRRRRGEMTAPIAGLVKKARPLPRSIGGIGVFTAAGFSHLLPLPLTPPELIDVGNDFHLVATVAGFDPTHCHVLTLARGGNQLWRADRLGLTSIELRDVPQALADVTWFRDLERHLQYHSTARGGGAAFHGQGVDEDSELEPLRTYLRDIDTAVQSTIGPDSPLMLVGPGRLPAIYRQVSRHRSLLGSIETHPDGLGTDELEARATAAVADLARQRTSALLDEVGALRPSGKSTLDTIEIEIAASEARVHTLVFAPTATSGSINRAVLGTIRHGGTAVPDADERVAVAAILRY